jgi:hypothetical protein
MKTFSHFWHYIAEFLLEWGVFRQNCSENQNTHFMFSNFHFSENYSVYGIVSKNVVEPDRTQMTSQYGAYVLHAG